MGNRINTEALMAEQEKRRQQKILDRNIEDPESFGADLPEFDQSASDYFTATDEELADQQARAAEEARYSGEGMRPTGASYDPSSLITVRPSQTEQTMSPDKLAAANFLATMGQKQDQGMNMILEATKKQGAIDQARLKANADLIAEQIKLKEKYQAEKDQRQIENLKKTEQAEQDLNKLSQDIADTDIVAGNYFSDKTTGQKIAAALAIVFGGIGQARGANQNAGLVALDKAIQQDIQMQRVNLAGKREALADKKTMYAIMKDRFKDEELAALGAHNAALDGVKNKMLRQAELSSSDAVKANTERAVGEILIKQGQLQDQFKIRQADILGKQQQASNKLMVQGVGEVTNEKYLLPMTEAKIAYDGSREQINSLLDKVDKYGIGNTLKPNDELGAEINVLLTQLKGAARTDVIGPGAVTDFERQLLDRFFGEGATANPFKKNEFKARLKQFRDTLDMKYDARAKTMVKGYVSPRDYRKSRRQVGRGD